MKIKGDTTMFRVFIALAVVLIAGEGVRLWWFSDSDSDIGSSNDRMAEDSLRFDPDRSVAETGSKMLHHEDPGQEKTVDRLLGHDRSRCGVWQETMTPGRRMHYTWVEYDSGNSRYLKDLFGHPPEVCAGKSGATPVAIHPDRILKIGGQEIPVRHVEFADPISALPFHIFKFAWLPEDSALQPGRDGSSTLRLARLRAAAHGVASSEARMLIAVMFGVTNSEDGWRRFEGAMKSSLSVGPVKSEELATTEAVD